jgi:DNA adenine methylase
MVAPTSILCRMGRKRSIRDIIKKKAPSDYKTYVEPFVGTGDIFFALDLDPSVKAVINDLDVMYSDAFKIIKSNPSIAGIDKYEKLTDAQVQEWVKTERKSGLDRLAWLLFIMCGSFSGLIRKNAEGFHKIYNRRPLKPKLEKVPELAEYMGSRTTVLNQDWKTVFRKYDSAGTFTYLDPPYEGSTDDRLYKESNIDYEEMAKMVRSAKGKVMVSINDSAEIRKAFAGLKQSRLMVKGAGNEGKDVGGKSRGELIITNY